ncbi:hypothetical protein HJB73_04060 [Rhizobium lentis]|uniref:hypothetical protein n=1 Tax=Rhizobium lentis TaxID=1138194 RepID=UPI001C829482|nr:hypothetical protein [Rhizobium lentis]MBX4972623.1 hypothetical protein [Rhizobium lentis]
MSAAVEHQIHSNPVEGEVAEVVAYHGGDMQAAIGTLLDDIRHLRKQLALAEGAMSSGMTRGWRPSYDRE